MADKLAGKVAVVTGGGRGIGLGVTRRFFEEGANVAIVQRNPPPEDAINDQVVFIKAELSHQEDIRSAAGSDGEMNLGVTSLVRTARLLWRDLVQSRYLGDQERSARFWIACMFMIVAFGLMSSGSGRLLKQQVFPQQCSCWLGS
jgi:short chain dehydrogenase